MPSMSIAALQARGYEVEILSGDTRKAVAHTAQQLGIKTWQAQIQPADKIAHIEKLRACRGASHDDRRWPQ